MSNNPPEDKLWIVADGNLASRIRGANTLGQGCPTNLCSVRINGPDDKLNSLCDKKPRRHYLVTLLVPGNK